MYVLVCIISYSVIRTFVHMGESPRGEIPMGKCLGGEVWGNVQGEMS